MRHLLTFETRFDRSGMYIGMLVHQHVLTRVVLLGSQELLCVSHHVEPWIYPFRTEDEVTIVGYNYFFYTLP